MPKKIKAVDLTETVNDLMREYGEKVYEVMDEVIDEVAKESVGKLHQVRKFKNETSGDYSEGWAYQKVSKTRIKTETVIYNESHAHLAHLLEKGHANRNGGRTSAYPHIKPVNDWIESEVVKKTEERLSRA